MFAHQTLSTAVNAVAVLVTLFIVLSTIRKRVEIELVRVYGTARARCA